jgi:hypothetical protein
MAGAASIAVATTPADNSLNIVMEFLLLYLAAQRRLASHSRQTDQGSPRSSMIWSPNATPSIKYGFINLNLILACDSRWRIFRVRLQRRGELAGGTLGSAATGHSCSATAPHSPT